MAVATFDTFKYAKALKAAGVSEGKVEAHVDARRDLMQTNFKELTTKEDLKHAVEQLRHEITDLGQKLKSDSSVTEQKLRSDLATSEQKLRSDLALLKWMVGSLGFGIVTILVRLFIFKTPF